MEHKYIEYLRKYDFKHPIEYSKHKELTYIVQEDLEINADISVNIMNHIYNHDAENKSKIKQAKEEKLVCAC